MTELPNGTLVTMIEVPYIEEYEGLQGTVVGQTYGVFRSNTHLVEFIDPSGQKNTVHAVVEPVLPKGNPVKYMIDFNGMLMMRFGYFDTEEDALAYIDEYFTEEEYRKWGWDSNYSATKPLFKPIPIY